MTDYYELPCAIRSQHREAQIIPQQYAYKVLFHSPLHEVLQQISCF